MQTFHLLNGKKKMGKIWIPNFLIERQNLKISSNNEEKINELINSLKNNSNYKKILNIEESIKLYTYILANSMLSMVVK